MFMQEETLIRKSRLALRVICVMALIAGVILHAVPYLYNRSLWLDEAMLASSILTRTFGTLVTSPLDWGQSAPIGYLYLVKIITAILGNGEYALRLWSLISFYGCLVFLYLILKRTMQAKAPLFLVALFSLLPTYIYYSNETKQYMSDMMFVLAAIFLMGLYARKSIKLSHLVTLYSVLIWFSFAAVFFIAAAMMMVVFHLILEEARSHFAHKGELLRQLLLCGIVAVSFFCNYMFWLRSTSSNAGGADYWANLSFPLIPTSAEDLKLIKQMLYQCVYPITQKWNLALLLVALLLSLGYAVWKKPGISAPVGTILLGFVLMAAASYLGYYPMEYRLLLFVVPLLLIIASRAFDAIINWQIAGRCKKAVLAGKAALGVYCLLCLAATGLVSLSSVRPDTVYNKTSSEISKSMAYLDAHLEDGDRLYIARYSIPVYLYETDYQDHIDQNWDDVVPIEIGPRIYGQNNLIASYEEPYSYAAVLDEAANAEDVALITQYDSVYIFTSHSQESANYIVEALEQYGTVEVVSSYYNTNLYHYVSG